MIKICFKNIKNQLDHSLVCIVFVLLPIAASAQPATLVVDAQLKSQPSFQASELALLNVGDSVEIIKRERGWYLVEVNQLTGWLTLLQLKLSAEVQTTAPSGYFKTISLRSGHSPVTATTGVRGIGEAEIANAKADFEALQLATAFQISPEQAKKFAAEVSLKSKDIEYREASNGK